MLLTVFTPTFNRADTLLWTFRSLVAQSFRDFEWLIVDDGSTDSTKAVVESFVDKADFPIRYYYQAHGGKHRAYNRALGLAEGEFFFVVDSDDRLAKNSLKVINDLIPSVVRLESVCGIIALKEHSDGRIYGRQFPESPMVVTLRMLDDMKCGGERSLVFKTKIARSYPFPTIDGESFMTESVVYDRIGRDWEFLAVNSALTVCEYMNDGLSDNIQRLMWNNPVGFMIYHYQRIEQAHSISTAIKHALRFHAFRKMASEPTPWSEYHGAHYRRLVSLMAFVGPLGRMYYKWKQ